MTEKAGVPVVEFLKKYWFLITTLVTMSAAWGENSNKINNLEDAVKANAATQVEVIDLKTKSAAVDERTKNMQNTQDAMQQTQIQQQRLLEEILLRLQKGK